MVCVLCLFQPVHREFVPGESRGIGADSTDNRRQQDQSQSRSYFVCVGPGTNMFRRKCIASRLLLQKYAEFTEI